MLTRDGAPTRNYAIHRAEHVVTPGFVRFAVVNNVVQTWATVRPGSSPGVGPHRTNRIIRSHTPILSMRRPNVEMDPTDSSTWQRQYRFT